MLHHMMMTALRMMDAMNADEYNVAHELLLIYLMLLSSCCDCYPFHVLMPFDKANDSIMMAMHSFDHCHHYFNFSAFHS